MKRIFILLAVALFFVGSAFAEEAIIIDFSVLTADIMNNQADRPTQNRRTIMDFSQVSGSAYTPEQRAVMRTSLAIENWEVAFTSSSRTVTNITNSYTREAPSQQWGTVLGVRVHFPLENFYSKATIKPPFEIPAYEPMVDVSDDGTISSSNANGITAPSRFEAPAGDNGRVDNTQPAYGVVKNVGAIRGISVNAYGLNFPHGLNVLLLDSEGNERSYFMGYLNFEGWAELTWNNPQYVMDVRNRELRLYPLYPTSTPFIKFAGFRIDRDADAVGGDFVGYFKNVKLIYDKAVLEMDRDIQDEALWNIIRDRETQKQLFEMSRFGQTQVLRYLEGQRQAEEVYDPLYGYTVQERFGFTPTPAN